jgi:hypothetical protein
MMKAKNKKHEDDNFYCHLLSFIGTMKANTKKRNKNNGYVSLSSCLKGATSGGRGENNNY